MKRALLAIVAALQFGFAAPPPPDSGASETLQKVLERYRRLDSFSADFLQIYSGHHVRQEESGTVLMKKPAMMNWEYLKPRRKLFVSDGKKTYFYVPDDRQVVLSDLRLDTAETPLLFFFGKGDPESDFVVDFAEGAPPEGRLVLRLTPRTPRSEFSEVLIEIDPASLLIRRLTVVEPIGNRNEYILSDFRENVRAPAEKFRFRIPPGTEVVRQ